jgi:release factor glutamine methyltransferase
MLSVPLAATTARAYAAAVERRAAREPLQQILGWEDFRGVRVRVTSDVLVPRPETETLVEWALELLPPPGARRIRVADVGTGSGCIACALVAARRDADVVAIDVSEAAARVADANAWAPLGVRRAADDRVETYALPGDKVPRARVVVGDLLAAVRSGSLDAIVANPPYLTDAETAALAPEVASHEPRVALSGGADGLDVLTRMVDEVPRVLRPGGVVLMETGGASHVTALSARLRALGFEDVAERADLAGITRFVAARAPGKS